MLLRSKGGGDMDLKTEIQALAEVQGLTFKELAARAGLNENGLHDKFRRNSLTVKDLCKLLDVLGCELSFRPKKRKR